MPDAAVGVAAEEHARDVKPQVRRDLLRLGADDAAMQGYVLLKKSQLAFDEREPMGASLPGSASRPY